jgi:anaerobic ribonucleoside-triphosphate reductase activating protein
VDGRFIQAQKDISLRFRGSRNQRLIDLNATRQSGQLCLLPDRQRGC